MSADRVPATMCEGYWDARKQRWVSYEERVDADLDASEEILEAKVTLPSPPPAALPKRRPATLVR